MSKAKDDKLIAEYFENGGTITTLPSSEEVIEPFEGPLKPSNKPIQFDRNGKRIYENLNKPVLDFIPTADYSILDSTQDHGE